MSLSKVINARLFTQPETTTTLWIENGYFIDAPLNTADINPQQIDAGGQLIMPGLVETHIHLDKACILHRCHLQDGTLAEAIAETRQAKLDFDESDVYQRGKRVLTMAIAQGTTHMRTHVELDPVIGLKGFKAIQRLQREFADHITLEICVFPQDGMLNLPGTEALLVTALEQGADVLGGCPYTDSDPERQIERLFTLAQTFDRDLDFHLDFDLSPETSLLPKVIEQTQLYGWSGRVTVGHATSLSALALEPLNVLAKQLAETGIAVTALPSTDLFLNGRHQPHLTPRGVAPLHRLAEHGVCCSLSTNNIENPFTPFGDASLVRQANLFANIAQLGTAAAYLQCLSWVSEESARLLRLKDYGLQPGCKADFICFDVDKPEHIITGIINPSRGFKSGLETFSRPEVEWKMTLPN